MEDTILRTATLTVLSLYKEIGSGERVALSKLAVQHYEKYGRPFRLAIDISIWSFQNQAANGGKNPELRTLYYRLVRLLSLSIQPLFVFDGPNKPPFKRGVRTNPDSASGSAYFFRHTKELLSLFGFPIHQAPGEAEAECALLQQNGVVDAVLSEDVDTLMFGCSMHLRNWTSASTKGKTPTHVDLYRSEVIQAKSGLERQGMILIAMMSGGDYLPGGVQGCGIKTACEAARGGFGAELCKLTSDDDKGLEQWRDWLQHELSTNDGGYFRNSHKALKIPENFPNKVVLSYYTHPATSSTEELELLSQTICWEQDINVPQLRLFVAELFEWKHLPGAKKYIRTLAPALLVRRLRQRAGTVTDDLALQELEERRLVKAVCGRRQHFATDGSPELRISFVPGDIVQLNLEEESHIAVGAGSETSPESSTDERASQGPQSPSKPRATSSYEPSESQKIWLQETYLKIGTPLLVETWEEKMRNPRTFATRRINERAETAKKSKSKPKSKITDSGMKRGALDGFLKLTKPGVSNWTLGDSMNLGSAQKPATGDPTLTLDGKSSVRLTQPRKQVAGPTAKIEPKSRQRSKNKTATAMTRTISTSASNPATPSARDNPWTLAKRPIDTFNVELPSGTRYSALGICVAEHSDNSAGSEYDENGSEWAQRTPLTSRRRQPNEGHQQRKAVNLTAQKVNRKLLFDCAETQLSPASDSGSLPSPSLLFSKKATQSTRAAAELPRTSVSPSPTKAARKLKGYVMIRESLEGAWRDVEPCEAERKPTKVMASVDVVDLTAGY